MRVITLLKGTLQCPCPGLELRLLDLKTSALTMRPLQLCFLCPKIITLVFLFSVKLNLSTQLLTAGLLFENNQMEANMSHCRDPVERLHTQFYKYFLGLNKRTPNVVARNETGRLPLKLNILLRIIKFWIHLESLPSSSSSLLRRSIAVLPNNA